MANPQGEPIWYELMCRDMATASRFYEAVLGWQITGSDMGGVPDYRFIKHGSGEFDMVGGAMQLTGEMLSGGARPMWAVYFCVEDVDAAVQRFREDFRCFCEGFSTSSTTTTRKRSRRVQEEAYTLVNE